MATSETDICNLALQKLGARLVTDVDEDTVNARAFRKTYDFIRDAEYRKHVWSFAIKRATLAEEDDAPAWGRAHQYQLPSDFIRLIGDYPEDTFTYRDWLIEGGFLLTDDQAPLHLRYVGRITIVSEMDPLFVEALACKMGLQLCETITQSNTKKADIAAEYRAAIEEAKRVNGIELPAMTSPDSEWITERA